MFTRKLTDEEMKVIKKIIALVEDKHRKEMGHDYSHVLEVCRWSIEIGSLIQDPVDPFITLCGALLHDLGRVGAPSGAFHGLDGGARAEEFLESLSISPEIISQVTRIVVRHTPTSMIPPETPEEKVVYDADDIERLGLMGMVRGIMGKTGSMDEVMRDRIRKRIADFDKLYYPISRELAKPYYEETLILVKRLEEALQKRVRQINEIESLKLIFDEGLLPVSD